MNDFLTRTFAILIALFVIAMPVHAQQQASAQDLVKSAQRAVGQIVKTAQSDPTPG
jgi:hypothetical protein